jgi:hypothetical protein
MCSKTQQLSSFDHLWENFLALDRGRFIEYDCDYPKYEFLQFLVDHKGVILHGSQNDDLNVLEPRATVGTEGANAIKGVWGTSDAMFPIFWATLNRIESLFEIDIDTETDSYFACLKDPSQASDIWCNGVVYVIDRQPFYQTGHRTWVSLISVSPLGKLRVGPGDFPLADAVETRASVEEILGFSEVKEVIRDIVDVSQLTTVWTTTGFCIGLFTDGSLNPICHLYFRGWPWKIGFLTGINHEEKVSIGEVGDIKGYADRLKLTVSRLVSNDSRLQRNHTRKAGV